MENGLLIVCVLIALAVLAAGREGLGGREALTPPTVSLHPESVEVDLIGAASSSGIVMRGARIDGVSSRAYFAPDSANPDDLFYAGAYDRLNVPPPPDSSPTEAVGLDDGMPATWALPDAAPVLLPEDSAGGAACEDDRLSYADRRWDALASSAIYTGGAGTNRRVTSAGREIAGSLSDEARFAAEPESVEEKLLRGSYVSGRDVFIPSLTVGDHEPPRL